MKNENETSTEQASVHDRTAIEIIEREREVFETLAEDDLPISEDAERGLELLEDAKEES